MGFILPNGCDYVISDESKSIQEVLLYQVTVRGQQASIARSDNSVVLCIAYKWNQRRTQE